MASTMYNTAIFENAIIPGQGPYLAEPFSSLFILDKPDIERVDHALNLTAGIANGLCPMMTVAKMDGSAAIAE